MVRSVSRLYIDTPETLGTCDGINKIPKRFVARFFSRYERHVRDFDHLPLFDALLVVLAKDLFLAWNREGILERMNFRLCCGLERRDLLVLVVLQVAVGQIPVVFCRFIFIDRFLKIF